MFKALATSAVLIGALLAADDKAVESSLTDFAVITVSYSPTTTQIAASEIPTTTTTTLPIPVYSPPSDAQCPQWHEVALEAGIPEEDLPRWDYIMWRESRCFTDSHNTYDPVSGSRGLTQINGFWCHPSRYFPNGWLQDQGVLAHCDDLYDPLTNLLAAKAIFDYGVQRGNCPWGPWTTRNTKWC
jgi:hypothetical protein